MSKNIASAPAHGTKIRAAGGGFVTSRIKRGDLVASAAHDLGQR
jgi:hypothetical protein